MAERAHGDPTGQTYGRTNGKVLIDPQPGATGRWQPTRAGIVNSWQWTDEQMLFRDGWLALTGQNGSGKSLTASMLIPTLLDGLIRPTALSVSGHDEGTLTDRHNNRRAGPPKTGLWWLEFGRTDPIDDQRAGPSATQWLTVGLWLRSANERLERAWFLLPARVGEQLILAHDRTPIDIDDLASQLAVHRGRLFTSHDRLDRAARNAPMPDGAHLTILPEDDFADAVRNAMFRPLDPDQYEALTSVLRALRRAGLNQQIGPAAMQAVLTSALPSLDASKVAHCADALTRMEQLRQQLDHARNEQAALDGITSVYRRYAGAVAALTCARLLHANTNYDNVTRQETDLLKRQEQQRLAQRQAEETAGQLQQALADLDTTIGAIRDQSRAHPGGQLEQLEQDAEVREEEAKQAEADAEKAHETAARGRQAGEEAQRQADSAAANLRKLLSELKTHAEELYAGAYHHRAALVSAPLIADPPSVPPDDFDERVTQVDAAFKAWAEDRTATLQTISERIAEWNAARFQRDGAAERASAAAGEAERTAAIAEQAAALSEQADSSLLEDLRTFAARLTQLPMPPAALLETRPVDLERLERWADDALATTLARLDVAGAESRANAAAEAAEQTAADATQAHETAQVAVQATETVTGRLISQGRLVPDPPAALVKLDLAIRAAVAGLTDVTTISDSAAAGNRIDEALETARSELIQRRSDLEYALGLVQTAEQAQQLADRDAATARHAEQEATNAQEQASQADAAAVAAAQQWITDVHTWAQMLQVLDCGDLVLPVIDDAATVDPDQLTRAVSNAHRKTSNRLTAARAAAGNEAGELARQVREVAEEISRTEQGDLTPEQPPWRPDRAGRPGAALWELVDFAPGVPDELAAKLDGALLAAGLLDAWVSPDGQLIDGDLHLMPGAAQPGRTLADLLVPDPHSPIPSEQVHALLASLQVVDHADEHTTATSFHLLDGTVRTGLLQASSPAGWTPRHIGPTARKHARQRRLATLRARHEELDAAHATATALVAQVDNDLALAEQEAALLPKANALLETRQQASQAATAATTQAQTATVARATATQSEQAAGIASTEATEACAVLQVPPDQEALSKTAHACTELLDLAGQSATAGRHAAATITAAQTARMRADETDRRRIDAANTASRARQAASTAQAEYEQLPSLTEARRAHEQQATAEHTAQLAAAAADEAAAHEQRCAKEVQKAITALHMAARTRDGRVLLPAGLFGDRSA